MGKVIADVAKYASAENGCGGIPVVEKHCVGELVERGCECDEERWRHNKAVLVHRKVVVDAVEEEVGCDADSVVW